jgi:hypothetical protein
MTSKDIQERLDRAQTLLNEAITMAKEDRQYALLEMLILLRKELAPLHR